MGKETLLTEAKKERKKDRLQKELDAEIPELVRVLETTFDPDITQHVVHGTTQDIELETGIFRVAAELYVPYGSDVPDLGQAKVRISEKSGNEENVVVDLRFMNKGDLPTVTMIDGVGRPVVRRRKSHPRGTVAKTSFIDAAKDTLTISRGIRRELSRAPQPDAQPAR